MKLAAVLSVLVLGCTPLACQTPSDGPGPNTNARIATHYFYWYHWPKEHFKAGRKNAEGHFHHFVEPKNVSYLDAKWHRSQFEEMAKCGIEFALPVYWGHYDHAAVRSSHLGIPPMIEALTQLEKKKAASVKIGLFFDTTILLPKIWGGDKKLDLRTTAGKVHFCHIVTGYFARFPKRFWARVDGRALVVLYGSHTAKAWDESLGTALRRAFGDRFPNEDVFLVPDVSWGKISQDRTTAWGSALFGPKLYPGVAQIGPGYDDSPVPGRKTPSRHREDGNFYRWSWRKAIASKPELVLIETWNEVHEGTEICATKETGRAYLDLTREWIGRLRSGDLGPEIPLLHTEPKPWNDRSWGRKAKGAKSVYVDFTKVEPERRGLREAVRADGPFRIERRSLRPRGPMRGETRVYFEVSDFFRFDVDDHLQVVVDAEPIGGRSIRLEYDSRDPNGATNGRYTVARDELVRGFGNARRIVFDLPRARFANRQGGATDFRLHVRDVRTAIRRVEVRVAPR